MEKPLGKEGVLKAEMLDGKIKLSVGYDGKQVDAEVSLMADSDTLVDALMALIPGDSQIEAGFGAVFKAALKGLKV